MQDENNIYQGNPGNLGGTQPISPETQTPDTDTKEQIPVNPYVTETQEDTTSTQTPIPSAYGANTTPQTEDKEFQSSTPTVSPMSSFSTEEENNTPVTPTEEKTVDISKYIPTIEENTTQLPTVEEPEVEKNSEIQELRDRIKTLENDMQSFMSGAQTMMDIVSKYSDGEDITQTPELQIESTDETYNEEQHQELPQQKVEDPSDPANQNKFAQMMQTPEV